LIEAGGIAKFLHGVASLRALQLLQLVLGGFQVFRIPIIAIAILGGRNWLTCVPRIEASESITSSIGTR